MVKRTWINIMKISLWRKGLVFLYLSLTSDSEWDRATWAHWTLGIRVCGVSQGGLSYSLGQALAYVEEYTPSNKVSSYRIPGPVKVRNVASRRFLRRRCDDATVVLLPDLIFIDECSFKFYVFKLSSLLNHLPVSLVNSHPDGVFVIKRWAFIWKPSLLLVGLPGKSFCTWIINIF